MEDQGQTVPPPRDLVAHYSYSSWSALFPPRFLIPSAVIPLEDDFRDYLRQDGMIMPIECDSGPQRESQLSDDEEDEDAMSTSSSSSSTAPAPPSFPSLIPQITSSILSLSQSPYASSISGVYPKLNFTAPQDASFLIPQGDGILRCKTAEDVVMVLKGSGFVTWDLDRVEEAQQAEEEEEDEPIEKQVEGLNLRGGARASRRPAGLELVLKRWTALEPAGEFRAFVRGSRLLGVSSRSTDFYSYLLPYEVRYAILDRIEDFFESYVLRNFPSESFTFDVHLARPDWTPSKSAKEPKLTLIDFNPWLPDVTSPHLFTWRELAAMDARTSSSPHLDGGHNESSAQEPQPLHGIESDGPVLRLVESEAEASVLTPRSGKFSAEKVPYELVDFSREGDVRELARRWNSAIAHAAAPSSTI